MTSPHSIVNQEPAASPTQSTPVTESSRTAYVPVPLHHLPLSVLNRIAVHVRANPNDVERDEGNAFTLFARADSRFTESDRKRLTNDGVKFVYIRLADQQRFQRQLESCLIDMAHDQSLPTAEAACIIYETTVELINEVLTEPELDLVADRLDQVARAIATLVLTKEDAFAHLFETSRHDFYAATHMVNVATWMVPVAHELGYRGERELVDICQAGLLHDIGKIYVAQEILNKRGRLSDAEYDRIKRHAPLGQGHISRSNTLPEIVSLVAAQHHERMDGSGYPEGRPGDDIHPVSRICAVVDAFDAMTAFRPYKDRTLSVPEAVTAIRSATPGNFDPDVVDVWFQLLRTAYPDLDENLKAPREQRQYARFCFQCPASVHRLKTVGEQLNEQPGIQVVTHNISRSGIGFFSQVRMHPGERIRVRLHASGRVRNLINGTVMRCRALQDEWWEVGMRFGLNAHK